MAEKTIDIASPILSRNERLADRLRQRFKETNTYVINVLSSPGSGKTTTILGTNERLRDKAGLRCAVIEGDIASDVDAITMKEAGMPAIQINTGGLCHLEGSMIKRALDTLDLDATDLIVVENVGNLVCTVDFDLGESVRAMILSVPEGHDKPLKYPGIFQACEAIILNKVDTMPVFDFDKDAFDAEIDQLNPTARVFPISATKGTGVAAWTEFLAERIEAARAARGE